MTDASGRVTAYQYDDNGRRTGTSFADGSSEQYSYTPSGELAAVTGSRGTTSYE